VPELVREGEAIAVQTPLKNELVNGDAGQVAGNESIHFQKVTQARQGNDVEAALNLRDFLDGCWN
jgi:hypothetical protein